MDAKTGIKAEEAAAREAFYGKNKIDEADPKTYWELLMGALNDVTIWMLIAAAIVNIAIFIFVENAAWVQSGGSESLHGHGWIEAVAIIVTVFVVSNVAAMQDYEKEKQFRKLNQASGDIQINVVRDGQNTTVSKYDLVVGDVVRISIGDIIEGDGLLLEGFEVDTDESALTGEPILMRKSVDEAPYILSGSSVQNGQGKYVIIAVGQNSEAGRIQALVRGQKIKASESQANPEDAAGEKYEAGATNGDAKKPEAGAKEEAKEDEEEEGEDSLLT